MDSITISNKNIVQLILQFLLENGLYETYYSLEKETNINLNGLENPNHIKDIILSGLWSDLIIILKYIKIPINLSILIFEHILLELLEIKEPLVARFLLRNSDPLEIHLKRRNLKKYSIFLDVIEKSEKIISEFFENKKDECEYKVIFDFVKSNYLENGDKIKSRERIAELLLQYVQPIPSSKLLKIIGIALLNEIKQNNFKKKDELKYDGVFSIFDIGQKNIKSELRSPILKDFASENKLFASSKARNFFLKPNISKINYVKFGFIKCATFSPNKEQLVLGTSKGYIFFIDYNSHNLDVFDEKKMRFYLHCNEEVNILVLYTISMKRNRFIFGSDELDSGDNTYLVASTSEKVDFRIWNCSTCSFVLIINNLHDKYITDFVLNKDGTCLLSSFCDGIIKIHGLKSERTIKYFPNINRSFIKKICYNSTETMVISGLSDGSINIWDIKMSRCIATYSICNTPILILEPTFNPYLSFKFEKSEHLENKIKTFDKFLIGTRENVYIVDISNGEKNALFSNKNEKIDIISTSFTSRNNLVFSLKQNLEINIFDLCSNTFSKKFLNDDFKNEYEKILVNSNIGVIILQGKNSILTIPI